MINTDSPILIFDGACGTNLQAIDIPDAAWDGREGCNELLSVTAPEIVRNLHAPFVAAGAHVVETNTFGASRVVLAEYGLEDRVREINAAAVRCAREAIGGAACHVAGSVGPTTKLPSLGHIPVAELYHAMHEQIHALVTAGVDLLVLETCQDLLQAKTAARAAFAVIEELGADVPVVVSLTIETTGTMLVGSTIAAAAAVFEPFPIYALGLNCATGPQGMVEHLQYLSRYWPGRISCMPNQGIPEVVDGRTCYPMAPDDYAVHMRRFVEELGITVVGGCCGTTPEHTRRLVQELQGATPTARDLPDTPQPALASLYDAVDIRQDIPPLLVGERANANGSKKFRNLLSADDFDGCVRIALDQQNGGAHVLDLCAAYAGRDEMADLTRLTGMCAKSVRAPLVIDSTTPDCIQACLEIYPGRCLVNSINLEDGGRTLRRVCAMAREHHGALVALTINETGMAMTVDDKVATARRIYEIASKEFGLRACDLFFDPLTFTIGSGDETLRDAAANTVEAIRRIKAEIPGANTLLGVSNVSFGLDKTARRILNSVFLHEAVEAGLDAAIVDAAKVLPLARISQEDRDVCLDLIYDRQGSAEESPLMRFIAHFQKRDGSEGGDEGTEEEGPEQRAEDVLHRQVLDGDKQGIEELLEILLNRWKPVDIINGILIPAMRHVGELFGRGELLLPFVLQSAEAMKQAVRFLEPRMDHSEDQATTSILLATVQGDVHDIGKNLVDIILSNNGYTVHNLGIKVPAEVIIEKARELNVDVIGLSGLLVKSALVMQDSMPIYRDAGLTTPILLGGAALTPRFVSDSCVPGYNGPVVYCADAFAGLRAVREHEAGTLKSTVVHAAAPRNAKPSGPKTLEVDRSVPVPQAPFLGVRHVTDIDPNAFLPLVNRQALFRGRWGYRRGKMSAQEYEKLTRDKVTPLYEELCRRSVAEKWIQPSVAYAYLEGWRDGDSVVAAHEGREFRFPFPRQDFPPHQCISDFFRSQSEGRDLVAFFVVTIGDAISVETKRLYENDEYHDYLMLHGFSVEVTDALAEYWHACMRRELGIAEDEPTEVGQFVVQGYRGSRYGFGYPACPDMEAHQPLFEILKPETIGVTLTENMQMVPEQTTSAIMAHHPQAKYFAV